MLAVNWLIALLFIIGFFRLLDIFIEVFHNSTLAFVYLLLLLPVAFFLIVGLAVKTIPNLKLSISEFLLYESLFVITFVIAWSVFWFVLVSGMTIL